jgi:hypothetical protein
MRTIRISGTRRLPPDAAASYQRMRAQKLPAGGITSAWRSTEGQRKIFMSRYVRSRSRLFDRGPFGDVRKYEGVWYKRVRGFPVSVPGSSKHNQGLAIDTPVKKSVSAWLVANGSGHGWSQPLKRSDPVHWEYTARKDKSRKAKAVAAKAPLARPVPRKPGPHVVTVAVLRGRDAPSLKARIVTRKRKGAVLSIKKWVKGDGLVWGRAADGLFYSREFLKPKA